MTAFTAKDKMREAQREVGQRRWVYPKLVASGKLTQAQADRQIAIMAEIALDMGALAAKEEDEGRLL